MYDKVVRNDCFSVWFVPDWFFPDWLVTQQRIKYLRDNNDDWYDHDLIEWYDGHKKPKQHKLKKRYCLLRGNHQDCGIGAFLRTRKKRQKNCF